MALIATPVVLLVGGWFDLTPCQIICVERNLGRQRPPQSKGAGEGPTVMWIPEGEAPQKERGLFGGKPSGAVAGIKQGSEFVIGNAAFYSCTFFSTIKLKTRSVTGQIATQIPSRSA